MSDETITTGAEAKFAMNMGIAKSLIETFDMLNRVLVGAVADDDRDRVEYLGHILQVVSDNITAVQDTFTAYDEEDGYEMPDFIVDENGGKHGILGYTITVQSEGEENVEHAGEVYDYSKVVSRLFPTVEEARTYVADMLFAPGSTVHIAEVCSVEDIQTVLSD